MGLMLRIEFETALHHGSGFGLAGVVDRAVLRDEKGMPYLAGSALKGKFRFAARQLTRTRGEETCGPPGKPWCAGAKTCLLCQVFGSPRKPGAASFEDAYPSAADAAILRAHIETGYATVLAGGSEVRASTAIDRHTRRVRPQHLYSTETVSRWVRFEAAIRGTFTAEQKKLLVDCARVLNYMGGDSARGLGFCRFNVGEMTE
jgi:CRISPR/Cas system CSM-associated protein Csm3 (group 7 of RAMP superfamily)